MPRISQLIISACAMTIASLANADCSHPENATVPDGLTASTEEMVAGQTTIKEYLAGMEAYLECLDKEEANLGREPTDDEKSLHNQRHNAAVDAMETVAAAFNEQVRAYKQQSP